MIQAKPQVGLWKHSNSKSGSYVKFPKSLLFLLFACKMKIMVIFSKLSIDDWL